MYGEPLYVPTTGDLTIAEQTDHGFPQTYHLRLVDESGTQSGGNHKKALCGHHVWGDTLIQLRQWKLDMNFGPRWCRECEKIAKANGILLGPGAVNVNELRRRAVYAQQTQ